jgi:hypothetical protein
MVAKPKTISLAVMLCAISVMVLASCAVSQTSLGDQRVGTSSGSFLRIGLGARSAAMGGACVASCNDVNSCAWNPAGLIMLEGHELALNHVDWPADISYNHACYGLPVKQLDGVIALQFGSLSTELEETREDHPYGTGRTFSFTDWLVGFSLARRFTDRFSGAFSVKYVREELGVEVGGPVTSSVVLDAGTYYEIGPRNMRLAVALMNFGPDMTPDGSFEKRIGPIYADAAYGGFAPATEFKFGLAFEPLAGPWLRSVVDIELCHPSDNEETLRIGGEAVLAEVLALRSGYDLNADEMKASFGLGAVTDFQSWRASLDYAVTLTDHLGKVHRFTFGLRH